MSFGSKICKALRLAGQCAVWAVLILLVGLTAYIMICNMQGKAAVVFGRSIVKVISESMEPSIHDGDYIIIKKTDCSELEAGDIICFYSLDEEIFGKMNTHRIIRRLDDGSFVTKGDANYDEDSAAVTAENIIGKYEGKVRFLRWINSFASVKKLILAAVVVIMSVTAAFEVATIAKVSAEYRAKKAEADNETAVRQAIDREKQKLYEQDHADNKEREDI